MGARRLIDLNEDELLDLIVKANRMSATVPPDDIGLEDAAQILGATKETVRRWCAVKGLPHARVGRDYRFSRAKVAAWIEDQGSQPGAQTGKMAEALQRARG